MNLLSGGFISGNKVVLDDYLILLPGRVFPLVHNDQRVTLGMRPEAVNISAEPTSPNGIGLAAEVEALEADFVHRIQTVYLRTGRCTYSGQCPIDLKLQIGQRVKAEIDPERLYFFDTNSGLRI